MNLQELNDQMIVLAAIQLKHTEVRKLHAEGLDALRMRTFEMQKHTQELQKQFDTERASRNQRMAEWDARIEKLVSGFGAFLAQIPKQS